MFICDAPGHGDDVNDKEIIGRDDYSEGSPDGLKLQDLMKEASHKDIGFSIIKIHYSCNKMIKLM